MKSTVVLPDGSVHCPVCNGTQFTLKRTARAKWTAGLAGVMTFGVGGALAIAAMPKRVYCLGCGEHLRTGGPADAPEPANPTGWNKVPATSVRPGDEIDHNGKIFTVQAVEPGGGLLGAKIRTDRGTLRGNDQLMMKVRRASAPDAAE